MIGVSELLAQSRTSPDPSPGTPEAVIDRFAHSLAKRTPPMPRGTARLRYPRKVATEPLRTRLIEVFEKFGAQAAGEVLSTMVTPVRAYPVDRAGSGRFVLLSAFETGRIVAAEVTIEASHVDLHVSLFTPSEFRQALRFTRALYARLHPDLRSGDFRRPADRTILFIADAGIMGASMGGGWQREIAAVCESYGYSVVFSDRPRTHSAEATQQMDVFGGTAVVVVVPAAGRFATAQGRVSRWAHRSVELDRVAPRDLLDDLETAFDLGLVDPPHVETWEQFAARAEELEGDYLRLTNSCKAALPDCTYHDPGRLWNYTQRLSEAARRRRVNGWNSCGPLAPYVRDEVGLEIALKDQNLPSTDFEFGGAQLSWEPHVKVDDAKNEGIHLGRIYFAIDDANERLVIHHIGLHL